MPYVPLEYMSMSETERWPLNAPGVLAMDRRKERLSPVVARVGGKKPPERPLRTIKPKKPRYTRHRRGAAKIAAAEAAQRAAQRAAEKGTMPGSSAAQTKKSK